MGVRGPSSSVCLSNKVPVPNPAGSSSVSPARSDFPFEGFFLPQRDPGLPRFRWGILILLLKVFLLLRILLVNFQNQLMFSYLHFLPGLLF